MTYTCKTTFTLWKNDEPMDIQLEPEAIIFNMNPGNELTFIGYSKTNEFKWVIRVNHNSRGVQLFPECKGQYWIEVLENGKLLKDWYKYM